MRPQLRVDQVHGQLGPWPSFDVIHGGDKARVQLAATRWQAEAPRLSDSAAPR